VVLRQRAPRSRRRGSGELTGLSAPPFALTFGSPSVSANGLPVRDSREIGRFVTVLYRPRQPTSVESNGHPSRIVSGDAGGLDVLDHRDTGMAMGKGPDEQEDLLVSHRQSRSPAPGEPRRIPVDPHVRRGESRLSGIQRGNPLLVFARQVPGDRGRSVDGGGDCGTKAHSFSLSSGPTGESFALRAFPHQLV
jgi:hypothetical protein